MKKSIAALLMFASLALSQNLNALVISYPLAGQIDSAGSPVEIDFAFAIPYFDPTQGALTNVVIDYSLTETSTVGWSQGIGQPGAITRSNLESTVVWVQRNGQPPTTLYRGTPIINETVPTGSPPPQRPGTESISSTSSASQSKHLDLLPDPIFLKKNGSPLLYIGGLRIVNPFPLTSLGGSLVPWQLTNFSDPTHVVLTGSFHYVFTPIPPPTSVSPLTLAILNQGTYPGSENVIGGTGFNVLRSYFSNDFAAIAYVDSNNNVVVAFRGTVGFPSEIATYPAFATGIPTPPLTQFVAGASDFVSHLEQDFPGAQITLTGHSLGGAVAQMIGNVSGLPTVTYNAPGAGNLMDDLQSQLASVVNRIHDQSDVSNISNLRIYGDQISLVGPALGSVSTLPSPIPLETTSHPYLTFLINHGIATVVDALRTGVPPEPGATGPALLPLVLPAALNGLTATFAVLVETYLNTIYHLDPPVANGYEFVSSPTGPQITSITIPLIPGIRRFGIQILDGAQWITIADIAPLTPYTFPNPIDDFRIVALDGSFVADPSSLDAIFDLTFDNAGTYNGSIAALPNEVPGASPLLLLTLAPSLNQASFHSGTQMALSATVTPGSTPVTADVYVAVQLPTGSYLFLHGGGSLNPAAKPLVTSWPISAYTGPLFDYKFGGGEPAGSYAWKAAFTQPGTMNFIGPIGACQQL